MTNEDKELLLKDLCSRLPYGVKGLALGGKIDSIKTLSPTECPWVKTLSGLSCHLDTGQFKPYLRPMSSMTEEEEEKFNEFIVIVDDIWKGDLKNGIPKQSNIMSDGIDYLNSIHIDYRGLIPKGLAIEAPEGMYKEEQQ